LPATAASVVDVDQQMLLWKRQPQPVRKAHDVRPDEEPISGKP
jgi:hypothetical protein